MLQIQLHNWQLTEFPSSDPLTGFRVIVYALLAFAMEPCL